MKTQSLEQIYENEFNEWMSSDVGDTCLSTGELKWIWIAARKKGKVDLDVVEAQRDASEATISRLKRKLIARLKVLSTLEE